MVAAATAGVFTGLAVTATAVAVAFVSAAPAGAAAASKQDASYLRSAAATNLAEIQMATVALQRSQSASVKQVATTILADHRAAESQLSGVAATAGVALPSGPNPQQLSQIGQLKSVSASSFDVMYLQTQVNDHQLAIQGTKQEIAAGSDAAAVDYARGSLPVLQKHLDMSTGALHGVAGVEATAPATNSRPAPSDVVSSGPEAFGAKSSGSDDTGWLIGLAVVVALVLAGALLWFRHSAGPNERL